MSPLSLSINMIFSYLSNQKHRTKINGCLSERSRIECVWPQGSILGPLAFNLDLIDLFYKCEEIYIAGYPDDTTPYSCARDIQTVIFDASVTTSSKETLLGILIDSELSFDQHISSICSKASKKLQALGRMLPLCILKNVEH